jgi:hypothetical protein
VKALGHALVLVAWSGAALACGTCDEDKIAATYDHAVVQRAAYAGHVLVYCAVQGTFEPARLAAAARRVRGVDPSSVRVSREPAALSFALDTLREPVAAALRSLESAHRAGGIALVRVDTPR